MKIAIAQMNPVVGDIENNAQKALEMALKAHNLGASLIIFPELYLCGYPPKDFLFRSDFFARIQKALDFLANKLPIATLMGAPFLHEEEKLGPYNAAVFFENGLYKIAAKKRLLPNYNVFDEKRYFSAPKGQACDVLCFKNLRFLVSICEDAWNGPPWTLPQRHDFDPVALGFEEHKSINFFINISASPYSVDKPELREKIFCGIAKTYEVPALVAGQVGANDQLLFDGHSLIIDQKGTVLKRAKACEEDLLIIDSQELKGTPTPWPKPLDLMRDALNMGIRDYVIKCEAPGVLLGLSGGIDSAVCAALAVSALGPSRVKVVFLPSKYTSESSSKDAHEMASNLGLKLEIMCIDPVVDQLTKDLAPALINASAYDQDIALQNIQARARGILLMGLSNLSGYLLMATSNKSELAVGFSTLYGDMCGAFSPLGDIYKTDVWQLANIINNSKILIPKNIIKKAPTAELKADQRDEDILPPYIILDQVLRLFIDQDQESLVIHKKTGISLELINHIINLVHKSEYKRRQAPFALMVSERVFGDARRQPIAAKWPYNA